MSEKTEIDKVEIEKATYIAAARARQLADMPMVALRKLARGFEDYPGSPDHDSRGQLVENVLVCELTEVG